MAGFGMSSIGSRDDFITASLPSITYNDDGEEVVGITSTITFWGHITDNKSNLRVDGKRRDTREIKIMCDSRDVSNITIDHTLTIAGRNEVYQVVDVYDSTFRFTSEVIAQNIQ